MEFRIGQGYDVHRIAEGLPMTLCGVRIECGRGFVAHSDGDGLSYAETMLLKTALRRNGVAYSEFRAAFRRAKFDFYKKAASPEGAAALRAAARFMTAVTDKTEFSGEYTEI